MKEAEHRLAEISVTGIIDLIKIAPLSELGSAYVFDSFRDLMKAHAGFAETMLDEARQQQNQQKQEYYQRRVNLWTSRAENFQASYSFASLKAKQAEQLAPFSTSHLNWLTIQLSLASLISRQERTS